MLSIEDAANDNLGKINPLRYRGYVYDDETTLYYLQSRYYNPAMGRFINADADVATGNGLIGNNMFAYCGNNPVNRTDHSGEDWWHWAVAAAIVVAAAAAVVITAGGAAGAVVAITSVANGVAASTTASTVAAGVFIGSSTAFAASVYVATLESDTVDEFAAYGKTAMYSTIGGGAYGGMVAYGMTEPHCPSKCFVAGTMIHTSDGCKPIESIQMGDMVWAWNDETGEVALRKVVETYVSETNELIHVFVNGEAVTTTPTHPFYSPVKGWTDATHLRAGDILVLVNGEYVVVEKVQHEILETPIAVFNFQVQDYHTYYVSDVGVLVHNACKPTSQNQMQRQVERGQAPNTVDRVDPAHTPGVGNSQPHVHFTDGTALNQDGTIHDAFNGVPKMTRKVVDWLTKNGWSVLLE